MLVDVDDPFVGVVIEKLGRRAGRMRDMGPSGQGRTRIEFTIPSRGLIGYRNEFLTDTRGTGIINHSFRSMRRLPACSKGRQTACSSSKIRAKPTPMRCFLQERGILFAGTGERVYADRSSVSTHATMIDRKPEQDQKLTNIRTTAADEKLF